MNTNTAEKIMFRTILSVPNFDTSSLIKAKEIFNNYIKEKVFIQCKFEDPIWYTTDEYSNIGIHYNFNKITYKRYYESILGLEFKEFVDYVKIFIAYTMGKNVLHTLQTVTNDIKRIIRTNPSELLSESVVLKIAVPSLCINFFSMLPDRGDIDELDRILNVLDQYSAINYSNNTDKKRTLAQFDSYFLFNDIINDYWKDDIPNEQRLFFYPLYLWWKITGVIPLRPREFILTRRKCITKCEDGYYLSLRRDNLKGKSKSVSYKICDDYYEVTYKIPDTLASEILKYIEFTKEYEDTDLNTLFIADPHYKHWKQKKHSNSRYFTYINMNTVMRYFFHDVIEEKYHLEVVYDRIGGHLKEGEINYINLGDTRHLALINIMAEGGTPVTAMILAGHDNIEMSAHYYSNITNLIECRTYKQYRLVMKGDVTYQLSIARKEMVKNLDCSVLVSGGQCHSKKFMNNDISDCLECAGPSGELGYCPSCRFYRKKGSEYFSMDSDSIYKRK
ncbi:hypothetical protein [Anaerosporobacter faecicola]|uniref:hypothetical protein n=1 Tax=Anaerosporobacter faecicola TaxID=2718714 RepID=UPI001A9BDE7B|nr:hypothetical protein [Anaerosporobacter faecicola]